MSLLVPTLEQLWSGKEGLQQRKFKSRWRNAAILARWSQCVSIWSEMRTFCAKGDILVSTTCLSPFIFSLLQDNSIFSMWSFLCKTLRNNKWCWSCPCLCICLCLSFACLVLKWLVLYCEATIQRSIIPYLPTFSIFLPSALYKDSALPNQAPLWGWAGCVWFGARVWDEKSASHHEAEASHPNRFQTCCVCVKGGTRCVCLSGASRHTPSEPCEVCWSLPSNYSLILRELILDLLAYLLLFHCFDRIMGCNYSLITCVWNLLSLHYH